MSYLRWQPHVQNHCHLNSHILKRYAQVGTMQFDYCRAQADTVAGDAVPMDLSLLGKGKEGDRKGKGKQGKGKEKDNDKATEYFAGHSLLCKAWGHMQKDCWWNESN